MATSNATATAGDLSGAGDRSFFTYDTKVINDRITAKVNLGTGNLQVTSPDLAVPVVGGTRALGRVYNSLALAPAAVAAQSPLLGNGWRFGDAPDRRLTVNGDGSVTFISGSGNAATFTAGSYTAPPGLDATLVNNGDGTWTMTYLESAQKLTFRADGRLTADADRNGNTVTITYPAGGGYQPSITGTAGTGPGSTVNLVYNGPGGRLSSMNQIADGVTRTVAYGYDPANNLAQVTDAAGKITTFGYDTAKNLTQITGPAPQSVITRFGYDGGHRATSLTQVLVTGNAVTTYDYTVAGRTSLTDADGHPPTTYTIDTSGRVTAVTDAKGAATASTYTPDAKVGTATNAVGGVTVNTYGANSGDSLTSSEGPTGAKGVATYATPGLPYLPDTVDDTMGNRSTYTYAGPGNRTVAANALAAEARLAYNTDGTLDTATAPGGGITDYGYNPAHQLTTVTPPAGSTLGVETYTYDGVGRLKTATTGKQMTSTYTYDTQDRPKTKTWIHR